MFLSPIHRSFVYNHVKQIIKDNVYQFIGISLLIWFLLYLLHILGWVSLWTHRMSASVQNKLWVYFYIKETPNKQDYTYSRIIEMKEKLEWLGMKVQYLSKDDAIKSVERKLPNILNSFEKYGIKNPLPATVYILFNNNQDYEKLKVVITLYEDIIANREDISKIGESIQKQESRILTTLGLTKLIVWLSIFLVIVLISIICSFLMLTIKIKFHTFRKLITIQQLLGTPYSLIKSPFIIVVCMMVIIGFILSLWLWFLTVFLLWTYTKELFGDDIVTILWQSLWSLLMIQIVWLCVILCLVILLWYGYLRNLLMKKN